MLIECANSSEVKSFLSGYIEKDPRLTQACDDFCDLLAMSALEASGAEVIV